MSSCLPPQNRRRPKPGCSSTAHGGGSFGGQPNPNGALTGAAKTATLAASVGGLCLWPVACAAGLAAATPYLISNPVGLGAACGIANCFIGPGLHLSVDSATVSWLSPMRVEGLLLEERPRTRPLPGYDHQGGGSEFRVFLQIQSLEADAGLLPLSQGKGTVTMCGLKLDPGPTHAGKVYIADALIRARFTRLPFLPPEAREGIRALKEVAPQLSTPTAELPDSNDDTTGTLSLCPVQFEADVQVPDGGRIILRQGELIAPEEVSDCLGGVVRVISVAQQHGSAASGPDAPDAAGTEEGITGQNNGEVASLRTGLESWLAALAVSGSQEDASFGSHMAEELSSMSQPDEPRQAGAQRLAAAVLVSSDNLLMQAACWVVKEPPVAEEEGQMSRPRGREPRSCLELMEPAFIRARLTTEPARRALSRVSPLLANVAKAEHFQTSPATSESLSAALSSPKEFIKLSISPVPVEGGRRLLMPASRYLIRAEPIKLALGRTGILDDIMWLLQANTKLYKNELVPAWTSATEVIVDTNGTVEAKRVDMLIGGVHLCTWGQVKPRSGMDVTLGIPGATLARFLPWIKRRQQQERESSSGEETGDDSYFLITVKGSPSKPKVDWIAASRQLVALGLGRLQRGTAIGPSSSAAATDGGSNGTAARFFENFPMPPTGGAMTAVPPPVSDLPWRVQR